MAGKERTVIAIVAAGLLLASVSFVEALAEVSPYFSGGISVSQRFGAIVAGELTPAASRWSRNLFLNDCLEVPRSTFGMVQPSERRRQLLVNCRRQAEAIASGVPTQSAAWLVVATTAAELGDLAVMRDALASSTRSAPFLGWLADKRSALAERHADALGMQGVDDHERDIEVMMLGSQGVDVLAQRYVRQPDLRALLTRIAETSSEATQQRFFARVKAHAAAEAPR